MRKLVLLVAAALVVSAPMLATSSTDSLAAAKAKQKAAAPEGSLFQAFADQLGSAGTADASAGKKKGRTAARKKRGN